MSSNKQIHELAEFADERSSSAQSTSATQTNESTTIPTADDLDYPDNSVSVAIDATTGNQSMVMEHEGAYIRVTENPITDVSDNA